MSRDKQIEEIQAEIIRWGENADKTGNYRYNLSEHLVDNNYRKAEDVAREIFEEIESICDDFPIYGNVNTIILSERNLAFLKKKYTEGKKDDGN